jgi:hypothetical protein
MLWSLVLLASQALAAPVPGNVLSTNFQPAVVGPVSVSSQTVGSGSVRIFAPNGRRKKIECWTLCSNTDNILISWGTPAVSTDVPLEQCAYWSTDIVVSTRSLNAISASGDQVIRCLEY